MTVTKLSPREIAVLATVGRNGAPAFHALEEYFGERMTAEELNIVVKRLAIADLVNVIPTARSYTVSITDNGRRRLLEISNVRR